MHVHNLKTALDAYWQAKNARELQAAYHEVLLYGGRNGYPSKAAWRHYVARMLRKLALWIET